MLKRTFLILLLTLLTMVPVYSQKREPENYFLSFDQYSEGNGPFDRFLAPYNGEYLWPLPNNPIQVEDIYWAPHTPQYAYAIDNQIFIQHVTGAHQEIIELSFREYLDKEVLKIVWSPDATQLALLVYNPDIHNYNHIYIINRATGEQILLVDGGYKGASGLIDWTDAGIIWLYSQRHYDYKYGNEFAPDQIRIGTSRVINVDGFWMGDSDVLQDEIVYSNSDGIYLEGELILDVNEGQTISTPQWSPDGQSLLYKADKDGVQQLYLVDISGENNRLLINHNGHIRNPVWSPDGQWIAYQVVEFDNLNSDIYVISHDGTKHYQITDSPMYEVNPQWVSFSINNVDD